MHTRQGQSHVESRRAQGDRHPHQGGRHDPLPRRGARSYERGPSDGEEGLLEAAACCAHGHPEEGHDPHGDRRQRRRQGRDAGRQQ
eukprot:5648305-Lingulodinium_polyedra.AAC.1